MREKRKFDKYFREQGEDRRLRALNTIKAQNADALRPRVEMRARKTRLAYILPAVAAVACIAVLVPLSVIKINDDNEKTFSDSNSIQHTLDGFKGTLKEYADERNNGGLKYFDWYAYSATDGAFAYNYKETGEFFGITEEQYNINTREAVRLEIYDINAKTSELDRKTALCRSETSLGDYTVHYNNGINDAFCYTAAFGYKYVVTLRESHDKERLFELVAELLEIDM